MRLWPKMFDRMSESVQPTAAEEQPAPQPTGQQAKFIVSSPLDLQRSFFRTVSNILLNSDTAYRRNRTFQRMMRHDPDVMSPLLQRQYAVALLDWDIEPENGDDKSQVEACKQLKKLIQGHLPRWHDMIRHLQEAVWYGPSAVNILYNRVPGGIAPTGWMPLHPDTLVFTDKGQLGLHVGSNYTGETVMAWDARARLLTPEERQAVVCHTFNQGGPDFEDAYEARYVYSGRGLRDTVWFHWMTKQTVLQLWVTYAERYAMGIRVGTYPMSNNGAKEEMETLMANLAGDVSVLMPRMAGDGNEDQYSLTILEPNTTGSEVFERFINEYSAGKIKEIIIGQTATSESTTSGMGSSVADEHASTFNRIVRFDAHSISDSLTVQMLQPLHEMNNPGADWKPRLTLNLDEVDRKEFMDAVKSYVELGGEVSKRQVRSRMGLEEPIDTADTLERQEPEPGPGMGGSAMNFARAVGCC